ncbi:MAG: hypothetical protein EBX50_12625 [Chitinophagia bacterium]|nr:hypothetical protein [Chitinophagia bacterium]
MKLDGWSPLEIFPPVPILENSRLTHFTTNYPLHFPRAKLYPNRAPGGSQPCNNCASWRAITVQYPGPFGVKSPPVGFKPF